LSLLLPEWISVVSVKNKSFQHELSLIVDEGEASAIALAHEIENKYLITDDLEARKLSIKLGLSVIGTFGVLLRAKQQRYISHQTIFGADKTNKLPYVG
jgi:predicted nucleic acid-binding protein